MTKAAERTVEDLTKEKEQIRAQLETLKTSSQTEKTEDEKKEIEDIKKRIENLKKEITKKLKSEEISEEDREKLEKLNNELTPFTNELSSLKWTVLTNHKTPEQENPTEWKENWESKEKWVFGKTRDWTKEQWWDVRDKEKRWEEPWLNTLRTLWFVATGVGAVSLIYKWLKKLFWKDKKEEKKPDEKKEGKSEKKMPRWKKWLLWAGWILWASAAWLAIFKNWNSIKSRFKEKLGKALTIQESVILAEAEVKSWKLEESPFTYHFDDGIEYDEKKQVIRSYWYETKINPSKKILEWLNDVVFPDYMQLVHAANIVNCMKKNFHNRCSSDKPFTRTEWGGGDMQVTLANWTKPECLSASDSNTRTWVLWATGWTVWALLWWYCAWVKGAVWLWATLWIWGAALWQSIDNDSTLWNNAWTISSWVKFQKFMAYLNDQKNSKWESLWEYREDEIESDSPLKDIAKEILDEIQNEYSENWPDYDRWDFEVSQDPNNKELFHVKSYNEDAPLKIEWVEITPEGKLDYTKIKSIKILKYKKYDRGEWLEIDFTHSKEWVMEAIKIANLTNKIRKEYHNMWWEEMPFWCKIYWYHRHLQIDTNETFRRWRDIVYRDTLSEKFPTLWQDLKKQINCTDKEKLWNQAHWNKDLEEYGSRYLRYLHQMRENTSSGFWSPKP